jgi:hypothetical protein
LFELFNIINLASKNSHMRINKGKVYVISHTCCDYQSIKPV